MNPASAGSRAVELRSHPSLDPELLPPAGAQKWAGKDSNLRRLSQQIYSLPRLTASVPTRSPDADICVSRGALINGAIAALCKEKLPREAVATLPENPDQFIAGVYQ